MPKIFDNIEQHLVEALNSTLAVSYRADFCVGYFNLRGWKEVADRIDSWNGTEQNCCRLLVGMQKLPHDIIREFFSLTDEQLIDTKQAKRIQKRLAEEFKEQLTLGVPTEADERGLRKLSRQIKDGKIVVKLFLRHSLHAKLYLLFRNDRFAPIIGYLGSSNLTLSGLSKQGELNVDVIEQDAAQKLSIWFDQRWNDRWCLDISTELAEIIDESWASERVLLPYHIYLKMAYHLSREARAGLAEFQIPKEFEHQLLEFQQKAVQIAAHHVHKRGGVIIGDVVGLGKTITATALAKIFDDDFLLETLIICPKNLVTMWEDYVHEYGLSRTKILPISKVIDDLPTLRRYRLVIIDESHNLRNRESKRFRAIQEYIQLNDSKVVLLSATPYNKTYLDLSNQLRLFIPDEHDLGISPERFIGSIGGKVEFQARYQMPLRSIAAFEKSAFTDDWRELMRLYLVRRTRSFIKEHYAHTDRKNGRKYLSFPDGSASYFPDRIPKKVEYAFSPDDPDDQYAKFYSEQVVDMINGLNLPRYGLGNYLIEKPKELPTDKETVIMKNLSRAGKRLMGFNRTNLFKRLESSGYAFLLSVSRHILRNTLFLYAIDQQLPLPVGTQEASLVEALMDNDDGDTSGNGTALTFSVDEEQYYQQAEIVYKGLEGKTGKQIDWIRSSLFKKALRGELLADSRSLLRLLNLGKTWDSLYDRQLNALYELCTQIHRDRKILIFTQYADTASYLAAELKKRQVAQLECVTGASKNPTELAYRFSPRSNKKPMIAGTENELRILVATDVLSEGQNLQDAHIVINYDLPWAIIRLIQRAGRVDRIGQHAEKILCYSFLPEDGLEQIIRLRDRLTQRIRENAEVVGSDETFFEGDPVNLQDLYHEKSNIFDDEDDGEVDLASYAFQIWKNATDANPQLHNIVPNLKNMSYSTKQGVHNALCPANEGVIVYTRTADDNDVLAWVDRQGQLITQSQFTILRAAQCSADTPPQPRCVEHHELVKRGLEYVQEIESHIGGQLGKKASARYRAYMRLSGYYDTYKDTLFVNEPLQLAVDDIYKYPLKSYAKEVLNRQLKSGISDENLANLVVSLREEDKLCIVSEDEIEQKEPQIICSMGLTKKE
ncbi:MAG: NgoFVII family restriction endonuclease [bacterium]|nr:NgoFVII family restriction endonuclease [bacterium]